MITMVESIKWRRFDIVFLIKKKLLFSSTWYYKNKKKIYLSMYDKG